MSAQTAKLLRKARRILSKRNAWTRRFYAYDAQGRFTPPTSPDAVCFCMVGALMRAAGEDTGHAPAVALAMTALERAVHCDYIVQWNDNPKRTKREVLNAFDAAIARSVRS